MKQFKSLVIAVILFVGTQVSAQVKIAHVDLKTLITTMPEMKTAQDQMKKIQDSYDKDFKAMATEYQTKLQKYESEVATAGDALNETRSKEMQDMGARIQKFQQDAQKELGQKELDLTKPLWDKAQAAIKKIAKAKGISYVLDASEASGLIVAEGEDLLPAVKKELGF